MYLKETFARLSILVCALGIDLNASTTEVDPTLLNMREGLLPPDGKIWRGSTIDSNLEVSSWSGTDPNYFEEEYGVPIQIYRTFKANSNAAITTEAPWIQNGGILIYSIQPKPWTDYVSGGSKDEEIEKYADAVKSMAPHKIIVLVGYEPDIYVPGAKKETSGTTQDYKDMWKNFVRIFEDKQVDNVVWAMDYSFDVRDTPELLVELWPDDNVVGWLFFNVFQFQKVSSTEGKGDCPGGLKKIY